MGNPIARCLVEAHSVTNDRHGAVSVDLKRRPLEGHGLPPDMIPNGNQAVKVRIPNGIAVPEIRASARYYLDLTPADCAGDQSPNDDEARAERERQFPILRYFRYDHLREPLKNVSSQFADLAYEMAGKDISNPAEMAAGLRKLLEAKDACVRSVL